MPRVNRNGKLVSATKSTVAEVEQRIYEIKNLLLVGKTRADILALAINKWAVGEASVDNYIVRARSDLREINDEAFEDSRARVITGLWQCYEEACIQNDKYERRMVLKQIGEFTGLSTITFRHIVDPLDKNDAIEVKAELLERIGSSNEPEDSDVALKGETKEGDD